MNESKLREIIREHISQLLSESIDNVKRVTTVYRDGSDKVASVILYDKDDNRIKKFPGVNAVSDFEKAYNVKMDDLGGMGVEVDEDDFDFS